MKEKDILYKVYDAYLREVAKIEKRGCRPPKSLEALYERNDCNFFYVLEKMLLRNKISNTSEIRMFMETANDNLLTFNMLEIVADFDKIIKKYNEFIKYNSTEEKIKRVKLTVAFLEEYVIINKLKSWDELRVGNPPLILKLWKEDKVDEIVLAKIFDFDLVKKKTWYKIYCKQISRKIKSIIDENNKNSLLMSTMDAELIKLHNKLN